jgi:hypothetical protein
MTCPVCGLENPDRAGKCDCGYDFDAQKGGVAISFWGRYRALFIILGPIAALLLLIFLYWIVAPWLFKGYDA